MKKSLVIVSLIFILLIIPFISAGFFSNFWGKITGKLISNNCLLDNPKDFEGNRILVSEHYYGTGNYENYAGKYCETVWGCTGFTDVTITDDGVKACRCDDYWGCHGESCVNDVSTHYAWERVLSVTCTGCPTACSGSSEDITGCGDGILEIGEDCDDGNTISGDGCSSTCTIEAVVGCGDGTCGDDENCTSCPEDCGTCVEDPGGAEGGGWTEWLDRDNPGGSGDWEDLASHRSTHPDICESPTDIECRTVDGEIDYSETGQTVTCSPSVGFYCKQVDNNYNCYDYEVRFLCPEEETQQTCIDTDVTEAYPDGKNYYMLGNTTVDSLSGVLSHDDFCIDETSLLEHFCAGNIGDGEVFDCASEGKICVGGECVEEFSISITENKKDMLRYSDREVFLISDKDWKNVLPLIPLTTWTGSEDCKKGYGTPDDVCVYPTLIFHEEVGERFVDLASGSIVTASSSGGAPVSLVLDGDTSTSWNSGSSDQGYLKLDLQDIKQFNKIELFEQYDIYYMDIYVSENDLNYQKIVENYTLEIGWNVFDVGTINARYIKFVLTDNPNQRSFPNWKGIAEIKIYGEETFNYESFDADSIIYFMQQYNAEKVTILGETPQELDNLLITEPELGAGLNQEDIQRIFLIDDYWTPWFDVDDPEGGDYELKDNLNVCENPSQIECEALVDGNWWTDWIETGQIVTCDKDIGLVCKNEKNPQDEEGCLDYRVRFLCESNYLSYWKKFENVVYVEDYYELALMASTYASLINAPLIIEGTDLDKNENFEGRSIICVGSLNKNCDEQYTLTQLQQKYVEETNTDKIILINPNDLDIKVEEEFKPEKSGNLFYELYSKTSLSSPILASAKHELIISTTATDYEGVDGFIEGKIDELFDSKYDVEYLTIIASPNAIQLSQPGSRIYYNKPLREELDNSVYGNIDEDPLIELMVGRIFGLTISDVSSLISRNIFYSSFPLQNNFAMLNGGGPHGDSWIMRGKTNDYLLSNAGLNMQSEYIRESQDFDLNNLEQQKIIAYIDHGSPSGGNYGGLRTTSLKENKIYFPNTLFVGDSCNTCAYSKAKAPLFCTNVLRRGAVGYFGSIDVMYIWGDPQARVIDFLLGTTIGEANRIYKNYQIIEAYRGSEVWQILQSLSRPDILVGDPTLSLGVDRPTNIDSITYNYDKNEKKLEISIPSLDEQFQHYFVTLGGKSLYRPYRYFIGCSDYEVRFYCGGEWTEWLDRDYPSGSGDLEDLASHRSAHPDICESPTDIECRVVDSEVPWYETGEVVTCEPKIGLVCKNVDNLEKATVYIFEDYVFEFLDDANLSLNSIKINNENYEVITTSCGIDMLGCKSYQSRGMLSKIIMLKSEGKNYILIKLSFSQDYSSSKPLSQLNFELIMEEE